MSPQSSPLQFIASTILPTTMGNLNVHAYRNEQTGHEPIAITSKNLDVSQPVNVRVHDACFTSEVLGSTKCDCNEQLQFAIQYIHQFEGIILYLHQEGRGIGLANKVAAYALQEKGFDTVEANLALHLPEDARCYEDAAAMLQHLNVSSIQLLTNNPRKIEKLKELGINVVKRIPIQPSFTTHNRSYLQTKVERMGHMINITNPMDQDID